MKSPARYFRIRAIAAARLVALVLVLVSSAAHAEARRTGREPWFQQTPVEARQHAQALFAQALDKHEQLLRGDAMELYEQALALWDNPDIRWNLALVLEDLGQYLRAHEQLESALRWDAALGAGLLREVRDRMRALETQRLARIETDREEPGAEITLDGQPWPSRGGDRSSLVLPGEHYIAASKPGYFPVSRTVYVKAGQQARVALRMDEDRLIETRRWTVWKPWTVVAAGVGVAAVGAALEWRALANRAAAEHALMDGDGCLRLVCKSAPSTDRYPHAVTENQLAIGAFVGAGTAVAVGLALVWLNQPSVHRTEARPPSPIELGPILLPDGMGVSALVRF